MRRKIRGNFRNIKNGDYQSNFKCLYNIHVLLRYYSSLEKQTFKIIIFFWFRDRLNIAFTYLGARKIRNICKLNFKIIFYNFLCVFFINSKISVWILHNNPPAFSTTWTSRIWGRSWMNAPGKTYFTVLFSGANTGEPFCAIPPSKVKIMIFCEGGNQPYLIAKKVNAHPLLGHISVYTPDCSELF